MQYHGERGRPSNKNQVASGFVGPGKDSLARKRAKISNAKTFQNNQHMK